MKKLRKIQLRLISVVLLTDFLVSVSVDKMGRRCVLGIVTGGLLVTYVIPRILNGNDSNGLWLTASIGLALFVIGFTEILV